MSGWGFKIDYAAAIADDDSRIAWAKRSIERGWYRRAVGSAGYVVDQFWELVLYFTDVSQALGLTLQDVADYAYWADAEFAWTHNAELPEARHDAAGRLRGKEIAAEIDRLGGRLFSDEFEARAELSMTPSEPTMMRRPPNSALVRNCPCTRETCQRGRSRSRRSGRCAKLATWDLCPRGMTSLPMSSPGV